MNDDTVKWGAIAIGQKALSDEAEKPAPCGRRLKDSWFNFCGEYEQGSAIPARCVDCGGTIEVEDDE